MHADLYIRPFGVVCLRVVVTALLLLFIQGMITPDGMVAPNQVNFWTASYTLIAALNLVLLFSGIRAQFVC